MVEKSMVPLLREERWTRHQENVPVPIGAAGGRSPRKPDGAQPSREGGQFGEDHPVCGALVGFASFY